MELAELYVQLALDAAQYANEIKAEIDNAKTWGRQLGSNFMEYAKKAAMIGAVAMMAAVTGVIAGSVAEAASLEEVMSGAKAVMSATTEDAAELKTMVMDLSVDPKLKVSATDAAAAVEMLGKNGLDATTIIDGAAKSTVLLSNATGGDFAQSADVATDVMALWNIEADKMESAVDGITSVVTNSKFGFEDYAFALAQGGGIAAEVGVSFDDFNTTIAAISPSFAAGSDAGTSFKTMLQRLVPASGPAYGAMRDIGIIGLDTKKALEIFAEEGIEPAGKTAEDLEENLRDLFFEMRNLQGNTEEAEKAWLAYSKANKLYGNQFFDSAGNMRDMAEIAGVLNEATKDLSEEQKNLQITTIFGTDAMRAALGVAGYTEEEYRKLQDAMGNTSAAEQAATRIDNLNGDLEIFKSVSQGVAIQIGDELLPILRELVQYGTELLSTYGPEIGPALKQGLEVAFKFIKDELVPTVKNDLIPAVERFHAFITENWDTIVPIVTGLTAAFVALKVIGTIVGFVFAVSSAWATLSAGFAASSSVVTAIVAVLGGPLTIIIGAVALAIGAFAAAWAGNWWNIREKTALALIFIKGKLTELQDWFFSVLLPKLKEWRDKWVNEIWPAIKQAPFEAWEYIKNSLTSAWEYIKSTLTSAWEYIKNSLTNAWEYIKSTLTSAWEYIKSKFTEFGNLFTPFISKLNEFRRKWSDEVWPAILNVLYAASVKIDEIIAEIGRWIEHNLVPIAQFLSKKWKEAWDAIELKLNEVWVIIEPILSGLYNWFKESIQEALAYARLKWQETWDTIELKLNEAWAIIEPILSGLYNWFKESIQEALASARLKWQETWDAIELKLNEAWNLIKSHLNALKTWLDEKLDKALSFIKKKWQETWDAIRDKTSQVGESILSFFDRIKEFSTWLSGKIFDFEFKIPDLPDWLIPRSPIPLHTWLKKFKKFLDKNDFKVDVKGLSDVNLLLDEFAREIDEVNEIESRLDNVELPLDKLVGEFDKAAQMIKGTDLPLEMESVLKDAFAAMREVTTNESLASDVPNFMKHIFDKAGQVIGESDLPQDARHVLYGVLNNAYEAMESSDLDSDLPEYFETIFSNAIDSIQNSILPEEAQEAVSNALASIRESLKNGGGVEENAGAGYQVLSEYHGDNLEQILAQTEQVTQATQAEAAASIEVDEALQGVDQSLQAVSQTTQASKVVIDELTNLLARTTRELKAVDQATKDLDATWTHSWVNMARMAKLRYDEIKINVFDRIKRFHKWLSENKFVIEIQIEGNPAAIPQSPLPIHTAWQGFENYINKTKFEPNVGSNLAPLPAVSQVSNSASTQSYVDGSRSTYNFYDMPDGRAAAAEVERIRRKRTNARSLR